MEKSRRRELQRSVGRKIGETCCRECWREVSERNVVGRVGDKCWRDVLWRSVGEEFCREALEGSVVEKCWTTLLYNTSLQKNFSAAVLSNTSLRQSS